MEYRLQNDKTKFIPIETKKKFSVQLELFPEMQLRKIPHKKVQRQNHSDWKKSYYESLSKIWQTNRQTNIWTKTKRLIFKIQN